MTPPATRSALALAAALAAGCTAERPPSADLFPLEAGHRWTYHQQIETSAGQSDSRWLVLETLPSEDYAGSEAFRRRSGEGVDYWLRRDATGIFRVAAKHELEDEPVKDAAPRYVLKEPLVVGTEWQAPTTAYMLERRGGAYPPELRHEQKSIVMRYRIAALQQTVTVPAGRFEGCLTVRGEAEVKLYADGVSGWKDIELLTTEWYCPGPGLVKLERDEPATSVFLTGGKLALQLHQWERP